MLRTPSAVWPVPIQLIWMLAEVLQTQGVPSVTLLDGSGLTPDMLGDGERMVSYELTLNVIKRALALSPVQGLGIDVGRRQTPSGWGMLGYAINCCATVGDALEMGAKYHRVSASLNSLRLQRDGPKAYWIAEPPVDLGPLLGFAIEEEFAALSRAGPLLTGRPIPVLEAHFTYPAPAHAHRYTEMLDCKLHFGAAQNQLVLDAACLDYPILQANPLSVGTATRLCDQFLAAHPKSDLLTLQIRNYLLAQQGHFASAEELATHLNLTSRTLRNHLRQAGQSFQQILDGVRSQLAKDYLLQAPLKVEEIATRLQFSDARSFRRAFKKWTGVTPADFRQAERGIQPPPTPAA